MRYVYLIPAQRSRARVPPILNSFTTSEAVPKTLSGYERRTASRWVRNEDTNSQVNHWRGSHMKPRNSKDRVRNISEGEAPRGRSGDFAPFLVSTCDDFRIGRFARGLCGFRAGIDAPAIPGVNAAGANILRISIVGLFERGINR